MYTVEDVTVKYFPEVKDFRGGMSIIQSNESLLFDIKRVFYMYGMSNDQVRGAHANEKSSFYLININGTCKIKVMDMSGKERVIDLTKPTEGVYIPKMIWKEMYDFSEGSVMLALSDENYDAQEYIRDKTVFLGKGEM